MCNTVYLINDLNQFWTYLLETHPNTFLFSFRVRCCRHYSVFSAAVLLPLQPAGCKPKHLQQDPRPRRRARSPSSSWSKPSSGTSSARRTHPARSKHWFRDLNLSTMNPFQASTSVSPFRANAQRTRGLFYLIKIQTVLQQLIKTVKIHWMFCSYMYIIKSCYRCLSWLYAIAVLYETFLSQSPYIWLITIINWKGVTLNAVLFFFWMDNNEIFVTFMF